MYRLGSLVFDYLSEIVSLLPHFLFLSFLFIYFSFIMSFCLVQTGHSVIPFNLLSLPLFSNSLKHRSLTHKSWKKVIWHFFPQNTFACTSTLKDVTNNFGEVEIRQLSEMQQNIYQLSCLRKKKKTNTASIIH